MGSRQTVKLCAIRYMQICLSMQQADPETEKTGFPFACTVHSHTHTRTLRWDSKEREAPTSADAWCSDSCSARLKKSWVVQPDSLRRASGRTTAREKRREGEMRREWWVGLSSTLPCQCVCLYAWVHERGRMGRRERLKRVSRDNASE